MSDSAFKTAAFPAYTTEELRNLLNVDAIGSEPREDVRAKIRSEIERREKRDAGDVSVMTNGERLRHARRS